MKTLFTGSLLLYSLVSILLLSSLQLFSIATATSVEGDILEDTTWTVTDSPYEIANNVTVKKGVNLTIEPDVTLRFNGNASLIVEGSLLAVGNSSNRITFTSNEPNPIRGQWDGIKFVGEDTESFILKFVDINYAKYGILVESLGKTVVEKSEIANNSLSGIHVIGRSNVVIKENVIKLNGNGISTAGNISFGMIVVDNSISFNDENGIYVYTSGADICRIFYVTISGNHIFQNGNGIYLFSNAGTENTEAHIHRVTVSGNIISSNGYGVRLRTHGWWGGYIYDSTISGNIVSFNEEGIDIYSGSNWFRWIANITISENRVFSNGNGISLDGYRVCVAYDPFEHLPFDAYIVENTVSANENRGISVLGDVRTNFTGNSVSYNSYGIYVTTWRNHALNNDIYQNSLYGMYVTNVGDVVVADVKAEYNYWGASSGPYHEDMNSDGQGDRVHGDEENLDFTPWLSEPFGSINQAPIAKLEADKTSVAVNQTVSFNGFASSDDSRILKFLFDFGDGETTVAHKGSIRHEYASPGVYNATLVVMDELGVKSQNTAVKTITAIMPSLSVQVFLNSPSVGSQEQVLVEVHVTDGTIGINETLVQLTSDGGGSFEPSFGYTDSNGDLNSTYFAPSVSNGTNVRIVATASKEGYADGSDYTILSILLKPPSGTNLNLPWIWLAAIAVVVVVAVVAIVKRKERRSRVAKPQSDLRTRVLIKCRFIWVQVAYFFVYSKAF